MKFTFICMGEKAVSAESAEYFLDMLFVLRKVVGIDQYVIQIDNDINVYHIHKDVIHEPLKSCRSVKPSCLSEGRNAYVSIRSPSLRPPSPLLKPQPSASISKAF